MLLVPVRIFCRSLAESAPDARVSGIGRTMTAAEGGPFFALSDAYFRVSVVLLRGLFIFLTPLDINTIREGWCGLGGGGQVGVGHAWLVVSRRQWSGSSRGEVPALIIRRLSPALWTAVRLSDFVGSLLPMSLVARVSREGRRTLL